MSAFFTPCTAPDCPRNTAGYCEKCANPHGLGGELSYSEGFQAGLKRGAEICNEWDDANRGTTKYQGGFRAACKILAEEITRESWSRSTDSGDNIEQAILKEANGG